MELPPLECLRIERMASGNNALLLSERVSWEAFPEYAESILQLIGGVVVERVDGPVERIWNVEIDGALFWLAFDDWPAGVSLEPRNGAASALVLGLRRRFVGLRSGATG